MTTGMAVTTTLMEMEAWELQEKDKESDRRCFRKDVLVEVEGQRDDIDTHNVFFQSAA